MIEKYSRVVNVNFVKWAEILDPLVLGNLEYASSPSIARRIQFDSPSHDLVNPISKIDVQVSRTDVSESLLPTQCRPLF